MLIRFFVPNLYLSLLYEQEVLPKYIYYGHLRTAPADSRAELLGI